MEEAQWLVVNGLIVVRIRNGDLEVSLGWLKQAGFKGKVIVSLDMFGGKPVFEIDLAPRCPTCHQVLPQ